MAYEDSFRRAERHLGKDNVDNARTHFQTAQEDYEQQGRPPLSSELTNRYYQFEYDLAQKWLGEIESQATLWGSDITQEKLNEFVREYSKKIRLFSKDDQKEIQERVTALRDGAKRAAAAPETRAEDIPQVQQLQQKIAEYQTALDEARARGGNFDPRVDAGAGVPLIVLAELKKQAEDIVPEKGTNINEITLRNELLAEINKVYRLIAEWAREIQMLDDAEFSSWTNPIDPGDRTALSAYQGVDAAALNAQDEGTVSRGLTRLEEMKSRIELLKNSLPKKFSDDLVKKINDSYPDLNIDTVYSRQIDAIGAMISGIDAEIERRQQRMAAFNETRNRTSEIDRFKTRIRELISQVEGSAPKAMTWETNVLHEDSKAIYEELEKLRAQLSSEEFRDIEQEVLFFDYRNSKRVLHQTITSHEWREVDFKDFNGNEKDQLINNRVYARFDRIINQLASAPYPGVDPGFLTQMRNDRQSFQAECEVRMSIFSTEMSLDSSIWWNGDAGERAQRGIPNGASVYWDVDHSTIMKFLSTGREPSTDPRLHFSEEHRLNPPMGDKTKEMISFDNPKTVENVTVATTLNGEIMRLLDMLYANKVNYKDASGKLKYPEMKGFHKVMHLKANAGLIPSHIRKLATNEAGIDLAAIGMTEDQFDKQVKRVWYMHTLFLNHSMLLTSSANLSDTAYYANQFLDYALSEVTQGVNAYDLLTLLLVVGKYDQRVFDPDTNPSGKKLIFDVVGRVDKRSLPKPKGWLDRVAAMASPVSDLSDTSLREKMLKALEHEHGGHTAGHGTPYDYLAQLPMVVVDKSAHGRYPFIPLPLQYMIFEDPSASYVQNRPGEEMMVRRWHTEGPELGAPITAADYVSTSGEILYENIPWDSVPKEASMLSWYNNGGNMLNLLALFRGKSESKILAREDIAALKKDAKYGSSFIPRIGMEALTGRINGIKLFDRFITVYALGKSIYLLENGQNLSKVEEMLNELVPSISFESVEAIKTVLKSGFGTQEALEEYGSMLREQIKTAAKYQG